MEGKSVLDLQLHSIWRHLFFLLIISLVLFLNNYFFSIVSVSSFWNTCDVTRPKLILYFPFLRIVIILGLFFCILSLSTPEAFCHSIELSLTPSTCLSPWHCGTGFQVSLNFTQCGDCVFCFLALSLARRDFQKVTFSAIFKLVKFLVCWLQLILWKDSIICPRDLS